MIHGVIFWIVRQRQRQVRLAALVETGRMLRDVVGNQLAVIRLGLAVPDDSATDKTRVAFEQIEKAILAIHETVSDVSEDSLAKWQSRYSNIGLERHE